MDVVNGKIVPARTERSKSDIWRALQPSGIHVRPGVGPTSSLGMNPGPARWNRRPRDDTHNILSSDPESSHESTWEKKQMQVHLETGDAPQTRRMRSFEGRAEGSSTAVEARETRGTEQSTVDHDGVTWIAPLRSLLRKELTPSDVGALGRIILPKKDAEGQLPSLETNAKYLEMEDYSFSRRWLFQYKCWINNKSRMYVLENTGEFVKYHGLKAQDNFIVYEDICGNLVVRGQKK